MLLFWVDWFKMKISHRKIGIACGELVVLSAYYWAFFTKRYRDCYWNFGGTIKKFFTSKNSFYVLSPSFPLFAIRDYLLFKILIFIKDAINAALCYEKIDCWDINWIFTFIKSRRYLLFFFSKGVKYNVCSFRWIRARLVTFLIFTANH